MKRYLFWGGGLLVALILVIVLASQLIPKNAACDKFYELTGYNQAPEESVTPVVPDWYVHADCQGVKNNLQSAYYFMAIAVALIGVGFVVRR